MSLEIEYLFLIAFAVCFFVKYYSISVIFLMYSLIKCMKSRLIILIGTIVLSGVFKLNAQEYIWKVGYDYFFDNREYAKSSYDYASTMQGMWFKPVGGISWGTENSSNALYAGVNIMVIPGANTVGDNIKTTLYYQYKGSNVLFRAGSFSREEVLSNYSDLFFSDSVKYFRPLMQGVLLHVGDNRNFINAWMDWTGHATENTRESFFAGFSGKASRGIFFTDFQSYMFHYAGTLPNNPEYGVSEQIQGLVSLGIEHYTDNGFKGLLSAGAFVGIERDRKQEETYTPLGLVARGNIELCGIGTENTLYVGDARMRLFSRYGNNLYWGSRFLQGSGYLQSKFYVRIIESNKVNAKLNCNLHFSEREIMLQQMLTVSVSIDNISLRDNEQISFPWMRIFR